MRTALKHNLAKVGIFPTLDMARRLPHAVSWFRRGCMGPVPPPIKRCIITAYLERYQIREFIETGTYLGDTLAHIARNHSISCRSIELDQELYEIAKYRFRDWSNIEVYRGDSGQVLPAITRELRAPALFWLDGHYSGGVTAKGKADTPISNELQSILDSEIKQHVILIDDARCFNGSNGYPFLDEFLVTVRKNSEYQMEVSADIIRLTPSEKT